ncbi:MAG TPA: arginine deiminase family protein [Steroidobacteraceae bacterium]|nr:arginine deiminase family protein [Steroidobacteraceae bacterium]
MPQAFVREPSDLLAQCELSYLTREPIDLARARGQHARYVEELTRLGCQIEWLARLPEHADGVFVEDTAVLVPEIGVITRPGAASRRAEVHSVAAALARHLPLVHLEAPATLEGGDVLRVGRAFYVGASARTNAAGVAQLAAALAPFGYTVEALPLHDCLHLKSAVTFIPPATLLVNPAWVEAARLPDATRIEVAPGEPYGANTLTVGGVTLVSAAYPRTQERLEAAGIATRALEVGELHKAEAALTCLSLIL